MLPCSETLRCILSSSRRSLQCEGCHHHSKSLPTHMLNPCTPLTHASGKLAWTCICLGNRFSVNRVHGFYNKHALSKSVQAGALHGIYSFICTVHCGSQPFMYILHCCSISQCVQCTCGVYLYSPSVTGSWELKYSIRTV